MHSAPRPLPAAPGHLGSPSQHPAPAPAARPIPVPTPILSAAGLAKAYGPTRALAGVDLTIRAGESVAIMGPSGSGKTTLLHVLSGVLAPDSGSVRLATPGVPPVEVTALDEEQRARLRRERLGFVFQEGLLLPELSAQENVALPLMLSGASRQDAEARARGWLAALGIADLAVRRIGAMSGGQAQRVAIARAQIADPFVVFADEPTGALDSATSASVLSALLDSTVGRGRTLVMVTHDPTTASRCSRVVHMQDGGIVSDSAGGAR
jgi:putative ABC transport system ATP-binding protein